MNVPRLRLGSQPTPSAIGVETFVEDDDLRARDVPFSFASW
jgi:hypothetical protein